MEIIGCREKKIMKLLHDKLFPRNFVPKNYMCWGNADVNTIQN